MLCFFEQQEISGKQALELVTIGVCVEILIGGNREGTGNWDTLNNPVLARDASYGCIFRVGPKEKEARLRKLQNDRNEDWIDYHPRTSPLPIMIVSTECEYVPGSLKPDEIGF